MYPKKVFYIHTTDGVEVMIGVSCTAYNGVLDVTDWEPEPGVTMIASFAQGYWKKVVYGGLHEQ